MLEKGYIGAGNVGQHDGYSVELPATGNTPLYEFSMKLWEGLEQELVNRRSTGGLTHFR